MIKECRLVVHSGTIEKCKQLGIAEYKDPQERARLDSGEIVINFSLFFIKIIKTDNGLFEYRRVIVSNYLSSSLPEITNEEFMKWETPIKVGDWVRFKSKSLDFIFKVESVTDTSCYADMIDYGFMFKACTKLTEEQIKVLCLNGGES